MLAASELARPRVLVESMTIPNPLRSQCTGGRFRWVLIIAIRGDEAVPPAHVPVGGPGMPGVADTLPKKTRCRERFTLPSHSIVV